MKTNQIEVKVTIIGWQLEGVQEVLDALGEPYSGIKDEVLADLLVNDLIDCYFGPEYWSEDDIRTLIDYHLEGEERNQRLKEFEDAQGV